MNFLKLCIAVLFFGCFSGCASMAEGDTESLVIIPENNRDRLATVCQADNGREKWSVLHPFQIEIDSTRRDLTVECVNGEQKGSVVIEPNVQGGFLVSNILLDFCFITCLVDFSTGAIYEYQDVVKVPMK